MNFQLIVRDPAKKKLRRLDKALQQRIVTRFDRLCADPLSSPRSDWGRGSAGVAENAAGRLADSVQSRFGAEAGRH